MGAFVAVEPVQLDPYVSALNGRPIPAAGDAPTARVHNPRNPLEPLCVEMVRLIDRVASVRTGRRVVVLGLELVFPVVSVVAATAIVYSGEYWRWSSAVLEAVAILVATKLGAGVLTGAFQGRWRFVGVRDAATIVRSALIAGGAGLILLHELQLVNTSLRLVGADTSLYILLSCGARLALRGLHEWGRRAAVGNRHTYHRAVIIGGGDGGSAVLKNILASPKLMMDPVAVVDDDRNKHGSRLHGVPIVGPVGDLGTIVEKYHADEIIIAIPSATAEQVSRVVNACVVTRVPFRIAPDPAEALNGRRDHSRLRVVQPRDLLGRPQAELDLGALRAELNGARIAITGAAGSIGSELTRQLVRLDPAVLYLIDRNENDLYFLCDELDRKRVRVAHLEVIQDVRDLKRMTRILRELEPTHVFHAAAFKHVPLMEFHLLEAVENNVLGTWATLEAARAARAGKFVLISTDKAVRPTSVMGATKRFVELLVAEYTRDTVMQSVIVRFGNVLGSNGSVVPLFQRQIAEGGPVTVTSREATRYFMTTTEAAQLVLQAASLRESTGKIAILDMGTPVRIWDLAEQLIKMSGLRPGADIEVVETALRPGEKLHEELWWDTENAAPSGHPRIMLAACGEGPQRVTIMIPLIRDLVEREDELLLRQLLEETVGLKNGNGDVARVTRGKQRRAPLSADPRPPVQAIGM